MYELQQLSIVIVLNVGLLCFTSSHLRSLISDTVFCVFSALDDGV